MIEHVYRTHSATKWHRMGCSRMRSTAGVEALPLDQVSPQYLCPSCCADRVDTARDKR